MAGEMPHDVFSRCFAYLSLFRPPGRSLQWKKVLRLLSELKELATMSHIQWEKQVARPNSAHAWGLAMERMIENPPKGLPLKSHGYLRAIAYEICDDLDKKIEVKRNQSERDGSFHSRHSGDLLRQCASTARGGNPVAPERVSVETMKDLRRKNMGPSKK
jgi:hypothetical protein